MSGGYLFIVAGDSKRKLLLSAKVVCYFTGDILTRTCRPMMSIKGR